MSAGSLQAQLAAAQHAFAGGDYARTRALASACLSAAPDLHAARALRVNAALQLQSWRDAVADLQVLTLALPQQTQFRRLLGVCWLRIGNAEKDKGNATAAIAAYRQAIAADPASQDARHNLALLLTSSRAGRDEAVALFTQVIQAEPENADIQLQLAEVQLDLGQTNAALRVLQQLAARPRAEPAATERLCSLLLRAGAVDDAATLATRHFASHPQRWREAGRSATELRENDALVAANAVLEYARSAHATDPAVVLTLSLAQALGLPSIYTDATEVEATRARYARNLDALIDAFPAARIAALQPDPASLLWSNFFLAYQGQDDRALQQRYGDWLTQALPACLAVPPPARGARDRPRLVLVSSFFRICTVGSYFQSWVEYLATQEWELIVIQLGPYFDAGTDAFERHANRLLRLEQPLPELARTIAALDADIVLYPELGMDARTYTLAALRLAPLQVCAWGHPVTSGLVTIDAYLSCAEMEPPDAQAHYSERLLLLPGLGTRYLSPEVPLALPRHELGLPEQGTLYLVPQSPFKLHPDNDAVLVEVLRRDPQAMFVLFEGPRRGPTQRLLARLHAALREVSPDPQSHVCLLGHGSRAFFLQVNLACDVILDSLYWSGGNTTLDALHCGLPVVTCPGTQMRGRQSMAMLRALGCEELIVTTPVALAETAVRLAHDPVRRAQLRQRILARLPGLTADEAALAVLQRHLRELLASATH